MALITMGARGETGEGATGRSDLYRSAKTIVKRLIASLPIPGTPRSVGASAVPTAPRPGPIPGHRDSPGPEATDVKNGYMLVSGRALPQSGIEDVQVVVGHARASLSCGLDEPTLAVTHNDVYMHLRIRERGNRVVCTPRVRRSGSRACRSRLRMPPARAGEPPPERSPCRDRMREAICSRLGVDPKESHGPFLRNSWSFRCRFADNHRQRLQGLWPKPSSTGVRAD